MARPLATLGKCYAAAIVHSGIRFDMVFGPAYKGIALAVATVVALSAEHGRSVPYAFNRKEAKDHGEGGRIVGRRSSGRVLIVDDVISAGTAVRESLEIIRAAGAQPAGVALALDRQERGQGAAERRAGARAAAGPSMCEHRHTCRPSSRPCRGRPWDARAHFCRAAHSPTHLSAALRRRVSLPATRLTQEYTPMSAAPAPRPRFALAACLHCTRRCRRLRRCRSRPVFQAGHRLPLGR